MWDEPWTCGLSSDDEGKILNNDKKAAFDEIGILNSSQNNTIKSPNLGLSVAYLAILHYETSVLYLFLDVSINWLFESNGRLI